MISFFVKCSMNVVQCHEIEGSLVRAEEGEQVIHALDVFEPVRSAEGHLVGARLHAHRPAIAPGSKVAQEMTHAAADVQDLRCSVVREELGVVGVELRERRRSVAGVHR